MATVTSSLTVADTADLARRRPSTGLALLHDVSTRVDNLAAEQARQGVLLKTILQALDRGRGPRDGADVALFVTIAEQIGERTWTGVQLLAHSQASPVLRNALAAADVTDARTLGWLCHRLESTPPAGLVVERVGLSRDGVLWRVRVVTGETRAE